MILFGIVALLVVVASVVVLVIVLTSRKSEDEEGGSGAGVVLIVLGVLVGVVMLLGCTGVLLYALTPSRMDRNPVQPAPVPRRAILQDADESEQSTEPIAEEPR